MRVRSYYRSALGDTRVKYPSTRVRVAIAAAALALVLMSCGGADEPAAPPTTPAQPVVTTAAQSTTTVLQAATTSVPPTTVAVATTDPPTTTGAPPAATAVPPTTAAPDGTPVTIGDLFFAPGALTVNVGDTVVWANEGDFPHTTTAGTPTDRSDLWHSGTLSSGESFAFTFDAAGTFQYFCAIHPNDMQATITVTDG